jgi:uncharacterized integral membrane protein
VTGEFGTGTPSGGGRGARFWIGVSAAVLGAIFLIQNAQSVKVDFLFSSTKTPLIFALLIAGLLGFVIGLALPRFRRHD